MATICIGPVFPPERCTPDSHTALDGRPLTVYVRVDSVCSAAKLAARLPLKSKIVARQPRRGKVMRSARALAVSSGTLNTGDPDIGPIL